MSAKGFGSLMMASGVAAAALGCYLVSLKVASERAKLETVEAQIVLAERDIRVLETEIGTRGRLAQLERWNANFIQLSAPSADQILEGGFQLATLIKPPVKNVIDAPVVLASAPLGEAPQRLITDDRSEANVGSTAAIRQQPTRPSTRPEEMMHVAGYGVPDRPTASRKIAVPKATDIKPAPVVEKPLKVAKPALSTSGRKIAAADPLAPLSGVKETGRGDGNGDAKTSSASPRSKETGARQ
jgi:hypothetical protein